MSLIRVVVAEDEPVVRYALVELLTERGFEVVAASDGRAALPHIADADLVITDLAMPELDGMGLLREVRRTAPHVPVIVLTARGSERDAVDAMKAGAHDYLTKPFDVDELVLAVTRAVERQSLRQDARRAAVERHTGKPMIGEAPVMRALAARIERLAGRDVTVLVRGETGTGKELVASLLHALGPRAKHPLVRFNAAALPAELAEAELFGHAKGAFTGAHEARVGYFARAHTGTLVLDEVGELPLSVQATLLRAVQDGEIQPVGATQPRRVDVRVIACTHRDLHAEAAAGRFREDLLYRLAVVELEVPPLRARASDIPALARAFAARFAEKFGLEDVRLSDSLVAALAAHPWPGNVRELENTLARIVAESDGGELGLEVLSAVRTGPSSAPGPVGHFRTQVAAFERDLITRAVTSAGGNRAEAARLLGLSRVTLLDRMKRLGL